jgi:hypothetical protein
LAARPCITTSRQSTVSSQASSSASSAAAIRSGL